MSRGEGTDSKACDIAAVAATATGAAVATRERGEGRRARLGPDGRTGAGGLASWLGGKSRES